eukprot:262838-Chlamydomonas_euryale.AAC.1
MLSPGLPSGSATRRLVFHFFAAPLPARRSNSVAEIVVPSSIVTSTPLTLNTPARPLHTMFTVGGTGFGGGAGSGVTSGSASASGGASSAPSGFGAAS